jgi:hypothetical protein
MEFLLNRATLSANGIPSLRPAHSRLIYPKYGIFRARVIVLCRKLYLKFGRCRIEAATLIERGGASTRSHKCRLDA